MKPPLDATGREISVGSKLMYCIDDVWSFGEVVELKERKRCYQEYIGVVVSKCSVNPYWSEIKAGKSELMFPQKAIIVENFLFLPNDFLKRLDEAREK